jgi:hypothetical protein
MDKMPLPFQRKTLYVQFDQVTARDFECNCIPGQYSNTQPGSNPFFDGFDTAQFKAGA